MIRTFPFQESPSCILISQKDGSEEEDAPRLSANPTSFTGHQFMGNLHFSRTSSQAYLVLTADVLARQSSANSLVFGLLWKTC
ncbi:hypothetical protein SCHPADRAFT_244346 [Schizopora paradoxa]|uniref:Uncharacterized protein n=1 Tax=Schizopora paradoxa TaxID=27342 RepID=A0A0H2RW03_9AGAM|nr:hypothetical protein SCHPADRAFT_244346 [Schizopora paradoxa]